jgi:ribonuclease P/MRP protein subunit RPP1
MKRTYVDLHFCSNPSDEKQFSEMLDRASDLGYQMVAVPMGIDDDGEKINRIRRLGVSFGIDIVTRLDLHAKSAGNLTRNLRKLRRRYELIAVVCDSKPVARQAAKDRRVDLLNFTGYHRQRYFDLSEAELASKALAGLEVDISPLLVTEGQSRAGLLTNLRREMAIARSFNIPIVLSSGVSEAALIREPMALVALSSLFDFDHSYALNAVSTNPLIIVKRNREKLCPNYISPGVNVVNEGKDC